MMNILDIWYKRALKKDALECLKDLMDIRARQIKRDEKLICRHDDIPIDEFNKLIDEGKKDCLDEAALLIKLKCYRKEVKF